MSVNVYILPLWFQLLFSSPILWDHWTDLNQTWTHIHFWLLFEKFGPNSPGHLPLRAGRKNAFWDRLWTSPNISLQLTWYQQSERNLPIYRDSLTCPKIWWTLVQIRLRTVGEFLPTPKFLYWETLPALPHGRYLTGQQANIGTCYVVARAYSLQQQNARRAQAGLCHASTVVLVTYTELKDATVGAYILLTTTSPNAGRFLTVFHQQACN